MTIQEKFLDVVTGAQSQRLTVSSVAVQLADLPFDARGGFWMVQDAPVFVSLDGQAPSVTTAYEFPAGSSDVWSKSMLKAAKFIRSTGVDAHVLVTPVY